MHDRRSTGATAIKEDPGASRSRAYQPDADGVVRRAQRGRADRCQVRALPGTMNGESGSPDTGACRRARASDKHGVAPGRIRRLDTGLPAGRFGVRIRQRSPRSRPGGPGHRGHRQAGLRERAGIRAVPGIRPRRPADPGRGGRLVRPARRRGRGPCPGLAAGQPPRPRRDGPVWPGHAPRRPGTRPDMAGRQRQLVFLTRAARRHNRPDGIAFHPDPRSVGSHECGLRHASLHAYT
jgi:hypothetical protein